MNIIHKFFFKIFILFRAFILIYLCLFFGTFISSILPFSIPGSIIGILILFLLLSLQLIPPMWLKTGCYLLVRYMALLFVPIGVGIMNHYHELIEQFRALILSCIISTLIVIVIVGLSANYIYREKKIINKSNNYEKK